MISNLENELNKAPIISGGNTNMSLSNILNSINKKEPTFELNPQFPTIRYIKEDEFMHDIYEYVEPNFTESTTKDNAKFILFSAPGATGKSALSKHICREYKGIYWELPNCKVAEFSFQGAIMEAVGNNKVSEFIESLKKGTNFLVIDAFDEAEAGSGRTGIEFFLRDLNNVTNECINICAILLARTESAIFIKNYCFQHNIPFKHYEVCYFSEENAKLYIKKGLERFRIPITDIVNECIDKQFKEITRILGDVDATAFLGYAPVLNALSASYAADRNTLNLLKNIHNSESSNHLLKEILDNLLKREREKFIQALKVKLPQITEELPNVYNETEQLLRIFEKIAYNGEIFLSTIDTSIPIEYHQEYLEVVDVQLPQHPFIKATEKNGCAIYNFTGTAFRDYVIAYGLSLEDANEFVRDYIDNIKYSPSQLLIGFYNIFSKGTIYGIDIPVIYNSFTAYAQFGDKINIYINGDKTDCSIEFMLERNNKKILILDFNITLLDTGISVNQLSNCYIDIEGKIYVGNSTNEARIYNSIINCDEIIWRSEHVSIEAYSPGECSLTVNSMNYTSDTIPRFEIKTDDKKNFKVICPSLNSYFKLIPYRNDDSFETNLTDFNSFANLVRRIFSCLRAHGKDAPARKKEFIDNRIINHNEYKLNILNFLLNEGILYTDEQDWLYKLKTDKLSIFFIRWHDVRDGNYESLKTLYNNYIELKS